METPEIAFIAGLVIAAAFMVFAHWVYSIKTKWIKELIIEHEARTFPGNR
jgi:V8-like Glu-specific endopeptidase